MVSASVAGGESVVAAAEGVNANQRVRAIAGLAP